MQTLKNIFAIVSSFVILMGANGFILEEYFCSGCNKEKHVVEFFEFGEINHNHAHCHNCIDEHHSCSCSDDEHAENAKISYINLDILFFNLDNVEVLKTTVIDLTKSLQISYLNGFSNVFEFKFDKKRFKIPLLLTKSCVNTDFCAKFSIFRL